MSDVKSLIKKSRRPTATVEVCLRGDLATEYDQLERKLRDLPASNKLGGDPEKPRLQAELDRIRQEMTEGTVPFVLRALSDADFQRLVDEHPPRREGDEINERDANSGFNRATFYPALVRVCTVDPDLDDEAWSMLLDDPDTALSAGQFAALRIEAMAVNGKEVDIPFSSADSGPNPD